MRRLLVLGLFALLPACAVEIDDPESSEDLGSENSGLVEESGDPAPDPATESPENPQLTSPTTQGPTGPTPDPWNTGPDGPTPDPWVIPVESDTTQKKTTH